jgi:hypothetical protein
MDGTSQCILLDAQGLCFRQNSSMLLLCLGSWVGVSIRGDRCLAEILAADARVTITTKRRADATRPGLSEFHPLFTQRPFFWTIRPRKNVRLKLF